MLYAFCQWPSQMCASVGRSLDNDNNNTIGLFSAFHGPQRRFREQTCKVVVVENHVTHRLSSSFHSTLTKTPSSPIAPAEKKFWRRHCQLHTTANHTPDRQVPRHQGTSSLRAQACTSHNTSQAHCSQISLFRQHRQTPDRHLSPHTTQHNTTNNITHNTTHDITQHTAQHNTQTFPHSLFHLFLTAQPLSWQPHPISHLAPPQSSVPHSPVHPIKDLLSDLLCPSTYVDRPQKWLQLRERGVQDGFQTVLIFCCFFNKQFAHCELQH